MIKKLPGQGIQATPAKETGICKQVRALTVREEFYRLRRQEQMFSTKDGVQIHRPRNAQDEVLELAILVVAIPFAFAAVALSFHLLPVLFKYFTF